jgi:hypothetical protein
VRYWRPRPQSGIGLVRHCVLSDMRSSTHRIRASDKSHLPWRFLVGLLAIMQHRALPSIAHSYDLQGAPTREKCYGAKAVFSGLATRERHRHAHYEAPLGAGLPPLSDPLRDVRSSWLSRHRKARNILYARISPHQAANPPPGDIAFRSPGEETEQNTKDYCI